MYELLKPSDVLSAGEVVVYSQDGTIIMWNGSTTFNVYLCDDESGLWSAVDCFTAYECDKRTAMRHAEEYIAENPRLRRLAMYETRCPESVAAICEDAFNRVCT